MSKSIIYFETHFPLFVGEIAAANNSSDFQWAERTEDRNRMWKARHAAWYATLALRPGSRVRNYTYYQTLYHKDGRWKSPPKKKEKKD